MDFTIYLASYFKSTKAKYTTSSSFGLATNARRVLVTGRDYISVAGKWESFDLFIRGDEIS